MSRHPPPHSSAGLPPRPFDTYRPSQGPSRNDRFDHRDNRDHRPQMFEFQGNRQRSPPRPPRDNRNFGRYDHNDRYDDYDHYVPKTGPALRPSSSVYHQPRDQGRPPREFTFRSDAPPAISAARDDLYRPATQPPPRQQNGDHHNKLRQPRRGGGRGEGRGGYRGTYVPKMASERAFLKGNREPTPEMMPGMDEDENGVRYKAMEDMSDSEEAEMDMSDDENAAAEQPSKKARTVVSTADGDSVPKWSNPDPYTALPLPDDSQRKKKDVVKLIRKARVEMNPAATTKVDPADDFISFNFDDETERGQSSFEKSNPSHAIVGPPTGPRFSHNANLHNQPPTPVASLPARVQQARPQVASQTVQAQTSDQNVPGRGNDEAAFSKANARFDANLPDTEATLAKTSSTSKQAKLEITSDPALGSRKRNIRDEIKPAPILFKIRQGVNRLRPDGSVTKDWRANSGGESTPWLEIDHSDTANMGLWLHKEIVDFYSYVKPRQFEMVIRSQLVEDLRSRLKKQFKGIDVQPFGSFPAGLFLPTADMDLVCLSDDFMRSGRRIFGQSRRDLLNFGRFIETQCLLIPGSLEVIGKAKVPLVKYVDRLTGLKVDISFENSTGLVANETFQNWKTQFPAMPILVTLIKHMLSMRGLNEPVNGGIGGFSVTCLVVSLLQTMPQIQSRTMIAEHHLGEVLMEFFDLYGNQFNLATTAIQVDRPGYLPKANTGFPYNQSQSRNERLCIIDPNNASNDISGGSSNVITIFKSFSKAYDDLQKQMGDLHYRVPANRRNQSILGQVFAGNYTSFKLQREHLAHIFEKLHGPIENE